MPQARGRRAGRPAAPARDRGSILDGLLFALTAALALIWLYLLGLGAARGRFATDECFHASVAEWILQHHALPIRLPEFYSGFPYAYPPLFHLLAALWAAPFGAAALHLLPIALAAATCGLLLFAGPRTVPARARAWALLACITCASLAQYAVRLYVEGLSTLITLGAALVFVSYLQSRRRATAVLLGVLCGLAVLAKLQGALLIAGLATATVLTRNDRPRSADLGLATVLALALALPWLVRNQILFGSALYPALAPDLDRTFYEVFARKFGTPPLQFFAGIPATLGLGIGLLALAGLAAAFLQKRWSVPALFLAFVAGSMVLLAFAPITQHRHMNPLIPLLALGAAWALLEWIGRRKPLAWAVDLALLLGAGLAVFRMPDERRAADPPAYLRPAFDAITSLVPPNANIVSLWTYDTAYYTGRPATWPLPWGQKPSLVPIFTEKDPERLLDLLHRSRIDCLLVPTYIRPITFDGANYPESLQNGLEALAGEEQIQIMWRSPELLLIWCGSP